MTSKLYCHGARYSGLDYLDRRYAWFRRLLRVAEERVSGVFPASWLLPVFFFQEFVRRTRNHLEEVLAAGRNRAAAGRGGGSGGGSDGSGKDGADSEALVIARLLQGIRSVLHFERDAMQSFTALAKREQEDLGAVLAGGRGGGGGAGGDSPHPGPSPGPASPSQDSIADAFDAFMGPWINAEKARLDQLLERLNKEEIEGKAPEKVPGNTGIEYNSSREMFAYIKASLHRCTEFSRGQVRVRVLPCVCIVSHRIALLTTDALLTILTLSYPTSAPSSTYP